MIIGSKQNKLEDIVRDMKSFTSTTMKTLITDHPHESKGVDVMADGKSWQKEWK